ncbi:T9SS type A sorting domain-containing protein [Lunatibacter salilacus]|uniref:T9SS type A sorting domain-containing protein n=1 Tax=Lunatibacter salilacus TaxID=2483804 RepID=UPI00131B2837|nr:T9SS type A sorting domain-containing protein [Lunatibacter salilacus]
MISPCFAQVTVTGTNNNIPVQEIRFDVNGTQIIQTANLASRYNPTPNNAPVIIETILLQDGTEIFATTRTPTVQNLHPRLGTNIIAENAVGVAKFDGTYIGHRSADFAAAMEEVVSTPDFRSYWDIGGSSIPSGHVFLDIMYPTEVPISGYLVVSERDGNSDFNFQALDENGIVIPTAETIALRGYQWNTRIVNQGNYPTQPQHLVVLSPLLFEASVPIFGFRVINLNGADGKIVFFRNSIQALPDESFAAFPGQTDVINVLVNDELKEQPATPDNVFITVLENEPDNFITLNADGTVDVSPDAPAGIYHIKYSICEIGNGTNCDEGTVSIEVLATLPVSWIDYHAEANDNGIKITWRTATEKNNEKFQVMRTFNPVQEEFELVGEIPGKGESTDITEYNYLDTEGWNGEKVYYRLDQIDWDGKKSSSAVFTLINYPIKQKKLKLFPNPYRGGKLLFDIRSNLTNRTGYIQVKDITGKQVGFFEGKLGEASNLLISQLMDCPPGLYFVSLQTRNHRELIRWAKE